MLNGVKRISLSIQPLSPTLPCDISIAKSLNQLKIKFITYALIYSIK